MEHVCSLGEAILATTAPSIVARAVNERSFFSCHSLLFNTFCRIITMQAVDGDGEPGPISSVVVTFDRNCTVLRDRNGNNLRTLKISSSGSNIDPQRLELCTAIGIERIDIMNDESITSLSFMRNIMVRLTSANNVGSFFDSL